MHTYFNELRELFELAQRDAIVLTPNKRLSRFIQMQHAEFQKTKGRKAWSGFACHSIHGWFQSCWEDMVFSSAQTMPLQINVNQEISIWLEVIRRNSDSVDLFNPRLTAVACQRAWNALVKRNISLENSPDISPLLQLWIQKYQIFCHKKNLTDTPSAINILLRAVQKNQIKLPQTFFFFAFDDIDPQVQRLIAALKNLGIRVKMCDAKMIATTIYRIAVNDVDHEITAAARWSAEMYANNQDATIGIVVPNLLPLRAKVERIFTEVFEPQYIFPENSRHASGFNISAGTALSQAPPIAAALLALRFNFRELNIEQLNKILLSPFIGVEEEIPARALLLERLRASSPDIRVSELRRIAGDFGQMDLKNRNTDSEKISQLDDLYRKLHDFHRLTINTSYHQLPSLWGELFFQQLSALGWPGTRSLDTLEFQQIEMWQQCMLQLNAFDYMFPKVTLSQALELVERISLDTQFQAQTTSSPIQILGVFEAAGMVFDYLWVMNLDSESWPLPTSPNSLLPLALQKREQMPRASHERELFLARQLTQRFKTSARSVVFSHALFEGDKPLRASALIEDIDTMTLAELPQSKKLNYVDLVQQFGGIEAYVDSCGPKLSALESVQGGTQILKDQSACPFKAFAKHRLRAIVKDSAVPGLTAAERGILVHNTLEFIWKRIRHQEKLLSLEENALIRMIKEAAQYSFGQIEVKKNIGPRLKQLECERILNLVRTWLELEKQRAPFTVVFNEKKRVINLATLPIHIRYDRIDKLQDGSLFIVDYKTAKLDIRTWAGLRPDEPQVPLYGVANRQNASGVAFGQLCVNHLAYKGIGQNPDSIPGLSAPEMLIKFDLPGSWPEILDYWYATLENLAREFVTGIADVKPKYSINTCRYCTLQSLCRVKEYIEVDDEGESAGENSKSGDVS